MKIRIESADFKQQAIIELLRYHLGQMHANSPPESVFALDLSGLEQPEITFLAAYSGDDLLGFGAVKELAPEHGEIKSMRTAPSHLRKGVAAHLLDHLIAVAKSRGYRQLSLETGSGPAFDPAIALYRRHGFVVGPAFGEYVKSPFNQFMHLNL